MEEDNEEDEDEKGGKSIRLNDFLKTQPYVDITVRAYCGTDLDGEGSYGVAVWKAFTTEVFEKPNEKPYGGVAGGTGFVCLWDHRREGSAGVEFLIRHDDLWYAFQKGLNARFGGDYPESEEDTLK